MLRNLLILFTALTLTSCGFRASLGNESGQNPDSSVENHSSRNTPAPHWVNWESIPLDYHPEIEKLDFRTDAIEALEVDAFSFSADVRVVYSDTMAPGTGSLLRYRVWGKSASWGDMRPRSKGNRLELMEYGKYECHIDVSNGKITALEGGCYVRIELVLPRGSEIEVYNVGKLVSRRFIPINTESFLKNVDRAFPKEEKFKAIDDYLNSYSELSRRPSLTSDQLTKVLKGFSWKDEKLEALRKLHGAVSDRPNLGKAIEESFSYFDRDEARRVVGI